MKDYDFFMSEEEYLKKYGNKYGDMAKDMYELQNATAKVIKDINIFKSKVEKLNKEINLNA